MFVLREKIFHRNVHAYILSRCVALLVHSAICIKISNFFMLMAYSCFQYKKCIFWPIGNIFFHENEMRKYIRLRMIICFKEYTYQIEKCRKKIHIYFDILVSYYVQHTSNCLSFL